MLRTVVKTVRHATALVRHAVRGISIKRRRSPRWKFVKHMHLAMEPVCQACGGESLLQVHHVKPYHLQPELELDLSNLITLCMGPLTCHNDVGHGDDYKAYNPDVKVDAQDVLEARRKGDQAEVARLLGSIRSKRRYAVLVRPGVLSQTPQTTRTLH